MMQLIFAVFFLVLALKIVGLLLKICEFRFFYVMINEKNL